MTGSRRIKKKEKVKARFPRKKRQERGNQRERGNPAAHTRHHKPSARHASAS